MQANSAAASAPPPTPIPVRIYDPAGKKKRVQAVSYVDKYGVNKQYVYDREKYYKLKGYRRTPEEKLNKIRNMRAAGHTIPQIIAALQVSIATVYKAIN